MSRACAGVYLRKNVLHFSSTAQTTSGAWVNWGAPFSLSANAGDEEKGQAMRRAIDGSTIDVPHPTNFDALIQPILDLAGVKAWSTFLKGVSYCHVERRGDAVILLPTQNDQRGFGHLKAAQIELSNPTNDELGRGLMAALAACA